MTSLNTIHKNILELTVELEKDGCLPFLDIMIFKKPDGTLGQGVYRKPTHTNLYLKNFSHHHPAQKRSALHTLVDSAWKIADRDHIEDELRLLK